MSGWRPRRVSSACGLPAAWAWARQATHSAAVANSTRCRPGRPGWRSQWRDAFCPCPGAEEDHRLLGVDEVEGAEVGDDVAFKGSLVVEVELLQGLAAGNRTARIRSSPPLDWRAATSRSRQAARSSSWSALGPGPLGQPLHRLGQRRGALRARLQVGEVGGGPARRRHHATPRARS